MLDRRESARDREIYGEAAEIAGRDASSHESHPPEASWRLALARKRRSLLARIGWWRDSFVGMAFHADGYELPGSDLAKRLRQSEKKKRQLQRRIKALIEG
ncbi:MAG TPA: PilZ domain-containing protein [Bradyrhizobium sp.]|nr:PilZ domain-containing protein [Bradyrhizobium sp.]